MKKIFKFQNNILLIILVPILFCLGCNNLRNANRYKNIGHQFVNELARQNYDACIEMIASNARQTSSARDTTKELLKLIHEKIVTQFGNNPEYICLKTHTSYVLTNQGFQQAPNVTEVLFQISNGETFDILHLKFDDVSGKIIRITTNGPTPIPNMIPFWLWIIPVCIAAIINIYMLIRVKRSSYKRKWPRYLAILLLNVPQLIYSPITGMHLSFMTLNLLGVGFEFGGYLMSSWQVGIPLGSLYIWWQLKNRKDKHD